MAETGRSAAAAASPGGDGGHGGGRGGAEDRRGRCKSPSASPRASPPPSKRSKVEAEADASQPKEKVAGVAEAGRSATAVVCPGGDGGHKGGRGRAEDCRGRSRRLSASPLASQPPSKHSKVDLEAEASQPKEKAAGDSSSRSTDANLAGNKCLRGSVVERTAVLIRDIQIAFPSAPNAMVLYQNQFLDLWACGRALEDKWAETWKRLPLVLHDADLAEAVQINLSAEAGDDVGLQDDCIETISKVLNKHPGPIECLRLDCTACPKADLLLSWVETLSAKEVQELVLLNLTEMQLEFPLSCLRSRSLTTLALGFFGLAALGIDWCDHVAPCLQWLNLAWCSFSGPDLSAVVCRLPHLSSLTIGGCEVTAGCGRQGLMIDSRTLTRLHLWKCTASAIIVNAPALCMLITGVTPALAPGSAAAAVLINLRSAQVLKEMHNLALHCHSLQICSYALVRFNRRWVASLPCLSTLDVTIQVCVPRQASLLMDLLSNLPQLQNLTLWRLDNLSAQGDNEACRAAWSLDLVPPCIKKCLEHLTIRAYRGGSGEVALVRRVMSATRKLLFITLRPHHTVPLEAAATPFDGCVAASRPCKLVVGLHEN